MWTEPTRGKIIYRAIVAGVLLSMSTGSFATTDVISPLPAQSRGYYLDVSGGIAEPNISLGQSSSTSEFSDFDDDSYYRITGGYLLTNNESLTLALELFYADHGSTDGAITNVTSSTLVEGVAPTEQQAHSVAMTSIGLGFSLVESLSHNFTVSGKLGLHYWDRDIETSESTVALGFQGGELGLVNTPSVRTSSNETSTDGYWGVGLGYDFSRKLSLGVDFVRYKFEALNETAHSKVYSIGIKYLW